jgi:hypothetical protein
MPNIFLFSNYLKPIAIKIKFAAIVVGKSFKILFRWNKNIQKDYLDYSTKNVFSNSYLVIQYKFKNALWYHFKGIKKTTKNTPLILDTANIDATNITLIVHGLFRKKKYNISVAPIASINTKTFKVKAQHLNIEHRFMPMPKLALQEIEITQPNIAIKHKKINLNHSSFKQTDFI